MVVDTGFDIVRIVEAYLVDLVDMLVPMQSSVVEEVVHYGLADVQSVEAKVHVVQRLVFEYEVGHSFVLVVEASVMQFFAPPAEASQMQLVVNYMMEPSKQVEP
jgi:hypothetical protein